MKLYPYLIFLLPVLFGCNSHQAVLEKGQTYSNFRGFEPVDPVEYNDEILLTKDGELYWKEIKLLNGEEVLQFLNNETVLVSIGQVNAEGGISYLPITISSKYSNYRVTMDYMKFATLPQENNEGEFIGFNRVGVGLRLIALITASESGINIGDLSSIGLAAKEGKIKGTLMIEIVGIKSKEITTLLPLPSEINQTTIQNAMQALATIKSKIYDSETELYPQVMAIKPDTTSSQKRKIRPENPSQEGGLLGETPETGATPTPEKEKVVAQNEIQLQIGHSKPSMSKFQTAQKLGIEAFGYLFNRDVEKTIASLDAIEKVYPDYLSIYEINRLLKSEKSNLLDPSSPKWTEIYRTILDKYSWKLPSDILERLKYEANK